MPCGFVAFIHADPNEHVGSKSRLFVPNTRLYSKHPWANKRRMARHEPSFLFMGETWCIYMCCVLIGDFVAYSVWSLPVA